MVNNMGHLVCKTKLDGTIMVKILCKYTLQCFVLITLWFPKCRQSASFQFKLKIICMHTHFTYLATGMSLPCTSVINTVVESFVRMNRLHWFFNIGLKWFLQWIWIQSPVCHRNNICCQYKTALNVERFNVFSTIKATLRSSFSTVFSAHLPLHHCNGHDFYLHINTMQ